MVAGESRVFIGDTGEKTVKAGVGNSTNSEERTVSDIVIGTGGEKYETDSKTVTSGDTKYFLVEGL